MGGGAVTTVQLAAWPQVSLSESCWQTLSYRAGVPQALARFLNMSAVVRSFDAQFSALLRTAYTDALRMLDSRGDAEDCAVQAVARAHGRWSRVSAFGQPGWLVSQLVSSSTRFDVGRDPRRSPVRSGAPSLVRLLTAWTDRLTLRSCWPVFPGGSNRWSHSDLSLTFRRRSPQGLSEFRPGRSNNTVCVVSSISRRFRKENGREKPMERGWVRCAAR